MSSGVSGAAIFSWSLIRSTAAKGVALDPAHLLQAPGEEGLHLAVPSVLVGGGRAAVHEVADESIDVLDLVALDGAWQIELATDPSAPRPGRSTHCSLSGSSWRSILIFRPT